MYIMSVTLWAIQDFDRVTILNEVGIIHGAPAQAMFFGPYAWMVEQMRSRLLAYWKTDPGWFGEDPVIQACVDGLTKAEVRSIEWFQGSGK